MNTEALTIGKTEKLLKDVRKMPIYNQVIPMEASVGFPIPLRKEGTVYVTLPFFMYSPKKGENPLYPPFATLTLTWKNLIPVEYVNLRFRNPAPELNWADSVGTFPHDAIAHLTKKEYLEKRHILLNMYDQMLDNLAENKPFNPQWNQEFSQYLRLLIEPPLEPYYRVLGEKFFSRFLPR